MERRFAFKSQRCRGVVVRLDFGDITIYFNGWVKHSNFTWDMGSFPVWNCDFFLFSAILKYSTVNTFSPWKTATYCLSTMSVCSAPVRLLCCAPPRPVSGPTDKKPKDIQFTFMKEEENQKIIIFMNLKPSILSPLLLQKLHKYSTNLFCLFKVYFPCRDGNNQFGQHPDYFILLDFIISRGQSLSFRAHYIMKLDI